MNDWGLWTQTANMTSHITRRFSVRTSHWISCQQRLWTAFLLGHPMAGGREPRTGWIFSSKKITSVSVIHCVSSNLLIPKKKPTTTSTIATINVPETVSKWFATEELRKVWTKMSTTSNAAESSFKQLKDDKPVDPVVALLNVSWANDVIESTNSK